MRGVSRKLFILSLISLVWAASGAAFAGVNPFKKSKNYDFAADVPWYESHGAALKSGAVRDGTDTNYYHLNIDKDRLRLRLGKNDPSGELEGTRILDSLAIVDVIADGRRLAAFDWCLKNQQEQSKKLKKNALVANDKCSNSGDFIINLDDKSQSLLKRTQVLEFVIEPYGRPVKLAYDMTGFSSLIAKINKPIAPVPAPVAKKTVASKPKVKPKVQAKPKAKPVVKPEPVKMCNAKPPAEFKNKILAVPYPCKDGVKKSAAEKKVAGKVDAQKKKKAAKLKAAKRQQNKPDLTKKQEVEWENKQAALWISRCKRHWKKGNSPCYCEKYLNQAPAGVSSTCVK